MTDETVDAGSQPAQSDIVQIQVPEARPAISARDAAVALASYRHKRDTDSAPVERQEAAPQEPPQSVERQDTGTDENPPTSEATETQPDTAEQPPIEPPRSWTAEQRDRFAALPRETQEYLRTREEERDRDVSRRQTEAAEQRKAMEAERVKVDEARKQYESMLPQLMQALHQQQQGQFSDIKTIEDVTRLAQTDWPRYCLWDAQQKQLAAVQQEVERSNQRQSQEKHQKLAQYIEEQGRLISAKIPELVDPKSGPAIREAAVNLLDELGFSKAELSEMWNGQKEISLHDHRLQMLVRDALRYRSGQAALKNAPSKPLPPVQRPGTAQSRQVTADAEVTSLAKRLDATGNLKDAAKFLAARRVARTQ